MSGALAGRSVAAPGEREKGRVEATKVKRYWPGRAPDWAQEDEDDLLLLAQQAAPAEPAGDADVEEARTAGVAAPVVVKRADDPRLRRLHQAAAPAAETGARLREREVVEPAVVVRRRERPPSSEDEDEKAGPRGAPGGGDDDEEDEEAIAARRAAMRERLRQQAAAAEAAAAAWDAGEEEESEEEEEESEYETDSSEEGGPGPRLMKPVFVPKPGRETISERELLEQEEEKRQQEQQERLEARKQETKEILQQRLELEAAQAAAEKEGPKGLADINTDDDEDEEAEYEQWKLRELNRIARDRDEREREAKEAEEKERWKNMTEEERLHWLALHPKEVQAKPEKKKWRFLQKYWHRGAFFQTAADDKEEDEQADTAAVAKILARDYSAPTGEDKFDKEMLPEVMQVRQFGKRGRTKWKHLTAEDTTNFESPWAQDTEMREKYTQKMAGMKQVFTRPKHVSR